MTLRLRQAGRSAALLVATVTTLVAWRSNTDAPSHRVTIRDAEPLWRAQGPARRIVSSRWDTLALIKPDSAREWLGASYRMAVTPTGVVVYAEKVQRLIALDMKGNQTWTTPPGTFQLVRDVKPADDGNIVVLDRRAKQLIRFGPTGNELRRIPLPPSAQAEQIAPLKGGHTVLALTDGNRPFVLLDSVGREASRTGISWPGFAALHPIARQGVLASNPKSDQWAFAFALGDGWFSFMGTTPQPFAGRNVEHTEFPTINVDSSRGREESRLGRAIVSAQGVAMQDSVLVVLFGGTTDSKGRIIDRFDARSGGYLGSLLLPVQGDAIAASGDRYYILAHRPTPAILVLRSRVR